MVYCPAGRSWLILAHNFLKFGRLAILIQFIKRGSVTLYHCRLASLILYFCRSLGQAIPSVVKDVKALPLGKVIV